MQEKDIKTTPLVSVIIACYNHDKYIGEAIDSVMSQTYSNFEIIISDDGSTDNSRNIISQKIDQYNNDVRIKCLLEEKNTSFKILEKAYSIAQGKYICAIGGDDMFYPEKLERQVLLLENNETKIGACFTWVDCIGTDARRICNFESLFNRKNESSKELLKYMMLWGNCFNAPSVMMRLDLFRELGGYNFGYRQLQDYRLWMKCLLNHDLYVIPEKLTYYRIVAGSLSDSESDSGTLIRSFCEQDEILYEVMNLIDVSTENSFLDEIMISETDLDNKCAKIKFLLDNCDTRAPFVSVGIRLYYKYINEEGFADLLEDKYGIGRKQIYTLLTERSLYSMGIRQTNKLNIFFKASQMGRVALDCLDKTDAVLVEELLDCIDAGSGKIKLDHLIALYNYCLINDQNMDDFVEVVKGLKSRGVDIFG